MHYAHILLAITGGDDEKAVVDEAMTLQSFFDSTLSIVTVNDPAAGKAHMMMGGLPRIEEADIREQLEKFGYGERADTLDYILVESESDAQAIARLTEGFDLLVMGHHPKGRLLAHLTDSTDENVADRIDCPILLVPIKPSD